MIILIAKRQGDPSAGGNYDGRKSEADVRESSFLGRGKKFDAAMKRPGPLSPNALP